MVGTLMMSAGDVPAGDGWLALPERSISASFVVERRRRAWRLGRYVSKQAVAAVLGLPRIDAVLREIEIHAAADGAPDLLLAGRPLVDVALSISHRGEVGLSALRGGGRRVGCDLELVEPHSVAMITDFYTPAERERVLAAGEGLRDQLAALVWSAKESALKLLREGLRRDTRSVEIEEGEVVDGGAWQPLTVRCLETDRVFPGWSLLDGGILATVVSETRTAPPFDLGTVFRRNGLLPAQSERSAIGGGQT